MITKRVVIIDSGRGERAVDAPLMTSGTIVHERKAAVPAPPSAPPAPSVSIEAEKPLESLKK